MKVKIFSGIHWEIEKEIQSFLDSHSDIEITHIAQSHSSSSVKNSTILTIFYRDSGYKQITDAFTEALGGIRNE